MIQKKTFKKLIGVKKEEFDSFIKSGSIQLQPARLIPLLKTGDEGALTSIFLTAIKLVKEYREKILKEIGVSRGGQLFYYREVVFKDISKERFDGLIISVVKGVIKDAVFFEMKNKSNSLELKQIESYINVAESIGVKKLVTVSNEFVKDKTESPLNIKTKKSFSLYHFSWTYLITLGRILLFKNDDNIEDEDQVQIMKEVLHYIESPESGVTGYNKMSDDWKELSQNISARKPLKKSDKYIEEALRSWYEEEKDIALLLSRNLGLLVKTNSNGKSPIKADIDRIIKSQIIQSSFNVKDAVSDIKVHLEFELETVSMSTKIIPPLDKGNVGKISWMDKQVENCKKKNDAFLDIEKDIWVDVDIKYAKDNIKVNFQEIDTLADLCKGREIQAFHISYRNRLGRNFSSQKKFVEEIEKMILVYYELIVQHLKNWSKPAPKLESYKD